MAPVPIGVPLVKYVIHGTILNSQTWSMAFWATVGDGTTGLLTQLDLNSSLNAVESSVHGALGTLLTSQPASWKYEKTSAYAYNKNQIHPSLTGEVTTGSMVGSAGPVMPAFTALCATLRTATPGRSFRGRMYVPVLGVNAGSDLQAPQDTCDKVATAIGNILRNTSTSHFGTAGPPQECSVVSWTKGQANPITSVVVNSQWDVQHRRTDKLLAARSGFALIP